MCIILLPSRVGRTSRCWQWTPHGWKWGRRPWWRRYRWRRPWWRWQTRSWRWHENWRENSSSHLVLQFGSRSRLVQNLKTSFNKGAMAGNLALNILHTCRVQKHYFYLADNQSRSIKVVQNISLYGQLQYIPPWLNISCLNHKSFEEIYFTVLKHTQFKHFCRSQKLGRTI